MTEETTSCPVCKTEMMDASANMKLKLVIEGHKTFNPPASLKICPSCGNVQHFVDVSEVRPLLHRKSK